MLTRDLAYRYYQNELTLNDLELIKIELKSDIMAIKNELDNKINNVRNELKSDIKDIDNKIDTNTMELKSTLRLHNWIFGNVITINLGILLTMLFK